MLCNQSHFEASEDQERLQAKIETQHHTECTFCDVRPERGFGVVYEVGPWSCYKAVELISGRTRSSLRFEIGMPAVKILAHGKKAWSCSSFVDHPSSTPRCVGSVISRLKLIAYCIVSSCRELNSVHVPLRESSRKVTPLILQSRTCPHWPTNFFMILGWQAINITLAITSRHFLQYLICTSMRCRPHSLCEADSSIGSVDLHGDDPRSRKAGGGL